MGKNVDILTHTSKKKKVPAATCHGAMECTVNGRYNNVTVVY